MSDPEEISERIPVDGKISFARGLSYEIALEMAQAAWTKVWAKRAQLRQPTLLLTRMNTIALNNYRSSLRRESQNETLPPPAASVCLDVSAIDVERLLTQCKPNDRKIIKNHYIDGYKAREIAPPLFGSSSPHSPLPCTKKTTAPGAQAKD